jgi:hexosaminidase
MPPRILSLVSFFAVSLACAQPAPVAPSLMPMPAELRAEAGRLRVTGSLAVTVRGHDDDRLDAAVSRALRRWEERTGLTFARSAAADPSAPSAIVIECQGPGHAVPSVEEDESYTLDVSASQAVLRAPTVVGAMRGLETLLQLLNCDADGWFVPAVAVRDQPRFPWRGLLIDVCRHWQPIEVIKRNLDGMALVKLNVLHLHLTEDQGFRVESKTHPRLHQLGSDGNYFTQDQIREIIAYAAARGIRVMPEFDIPGHATSWVVGEPDVASLPGPYSIERHWGVFDPVLDPTNEKTYALLDDFLGEMAALFPDAYLHIGGDENNGKQWNASPRIQAFIREHDLKNNEGLHAYFNRRVQAILAKHGKRLIGWDEILHPDLPKECAVHSWRGAAGLADAARQGHPVVLSNGYYIDLIYPASTHYVNDPVPANTPLTPAEQKLVLGGEATMWSEWATPETIDSRIWPRTAAIAERLWSPREVNDIPDMYRRLALVSRRLEEAGLLHDKNQEAMLRRLAGDQADDSTRAALRVFIDALEPVKRYSRGKYQRATQFTPLTGLADCARPDSAAARNFTTQVEAFLFSEGNADATKADALAQQLEAWRSAGHIVATSLAPTLPRLREAAPLAQALSDASDAALQALQALNDGHAPDEATRKTQLAALTAAEPRAAVELPALPALKLLIVASHEQAKRASLSAPAWRDHLLELTTEKKAPVPAH